jgi:hypothetical protein
LFVQRIIDTLSIGTNHQNLVAKQQDKLGLIPLIERKNFVSKYSRISGAWFCVLRSIVCGVVIAHQTTPYFLRPTMSIDRELLLVSARKSRGSNHLDKDDYDVRCGDIEGPVVGRIFWSTVAPTTTPWFWTIIKLKP